MDKQLTRWARLGYTSVLLYGRRYALERGYGYHVIFNRAQPSKSELVRFPLAR